MNPQEQFEHIVTLIADREQSGYPTFYTIKIEKFGKLSPIAEREAGDKNFSNKVFKCLSTYNPDKIIVELYTGKSRNVTQPFQSFKIPVKQTSGDMTLSGTEDKPEITPSENVISVERFYDTKFEMQMRLMQLQYENQKLNDAIEKLNEIIEEQKGEIDELEKEQEKTLKQQKDNFTNISLGYAGSIALEKFVQSKTGSALLKGFLGVTDEQLKGLKSGEETKSTDENQAQKSTATLVSNEQEKPQEQEKPLTQEEQTRLKILEIINEHLKKLDNPTLRLYFEVMGKVAGSKDTLNKVYQYLLDIGQKKETKEITPPKNIINLSQETTGTEPEKTGEEETEPFDSS